MAIPETTREWLERYEKKYQKAFDNYQATGEARYDRQQIEYDIICDAFRAKLQQKSERDDSVKKRLTNMHAVVDRLVNEKYTKAEVIKMLRDAVYW